MDYLHLKVIHLTALALTFMGLAGILAAKATGTLPVHKRVPFHLAFGIGLLGLAATGIMMSISLGVAHPMAGWVKGKLVIWFLVAGSMVLATRFSRYPGPVLALFTLLVAAAAWLAVLKPF